MTWRKHTCSESFVTRRVNSVQYAKNKVWRQRWFYLRNNVFDRIFYWIPEKFSVLCWVKIKRVCDCIEQCVWKCTRNLRMQLPQPCPLDSVCACTEMGSTGHVGTGARAAGGGLTLSVTQGILIQVGLCTELRTGVGDLYFWQRCISGWIMTRFPSRFYSLLLLFVRLPPVALQDSCVAGPATSPVPFFNHTGKSWWFVDGWASGLEHEAETCGISPFPQHSALGLGQGNLSLISKEPCRKAVCLSGIRIP